MRLCQGIAYRRESTHLHAYEFERCACHHSLQGIDRFGDGQAYNRADYSARYNRAGVEDNRAWRRAGKECTCVVLLRRVQRRRDESPANQPDKAKHVRCLQQPSTTLQGRNCRALWPPFEALF